VRLLPHWRYARAGVLHLHGSGSNGKGTFTSVLLKVLGDCGVSASVDTFLVKKNNSSSGPNSDVARLAGARLVSASESEAGQRLAESLVKSITGGDPLTTRFLHREFFEFVPDFKLILSTNHKPVIKGTDEAIWRRIRLIPFNVQFKKRPTEGDSLNGGPWRDNALRSKLEAELPGILRWCVDGCLRWQSEGLEPPSKVMEASSEYREDMDTLAEFLDAKTQSGGQVSKFDLYAKYVSWCDDQQMNDRERLSKRAFGMAMNERGIASAKNDGERVWLGIELRF